MEKIENKYCLSKEEAEISLKEGRHLGRGELSLYLAVLELEIDDLRGKKVLDVGSGSGEIVQKINEHGGIGVGLDPVYKFKEGRDVAVKKDNLVAGLAGGKNNFPFGDESFDLILNNFSTFNYAKTGEAIEANINEQLRILRVGGSIYVFPLRWSFKLNDHVPDLEDNFVDEKDEVCDSFVNNIKKLEARDDLEVFFGEPNYKKLGRIIMFSPDKGKKMYYLRITKIKE